MGTFRSTPIASTYYQVKCGGDAAALKGIMKAIMETAETTGGVLDHEFIAEHTNGFTEFAADLRRTEWADIEKACGLTKVELERVAAKMKELARDGIALLVVEHLMGFIDQVTDRIIVMNAGKEIFEGRLAEAARNAQVVEVFLGDEHAA